MSSASSRRRLSFRSFALLALIAAVPAACLNLEGLPADSTTSTSGGGGAGGDGTGGTISSSTMMSSAMSSSSTGGSTTCKPNVDTVDCYTGPTGTLGKGICKSGSKTCLADGKNYGTCVGDILPTTENCATPEDEDCDGVAPACPGTPVGGDGFGTNSKNEVVFAVATDKSSNILLGGVEDSSQSGVLTYAINSGNGVVTKFTPTGQKSWSKSLTTTGGYSVVRGVATDAMGDVFVVGEYQGAISGNGFNISQSNSIDIFVAKLGAGNGTVLWQKRFNGDSGQFPTAIALDSSGNIFLTGKTFGQVDFGAGQISGGGGADLFVVKLDKDGAHVWSKVYGDASPQIGNGVAATFEGDVVVVGSLGGTMDFDGESITTAGSDDVFVAKLKGNLGDVAWVHRYGNDKSQQATGVAVGAGANGPIFITGSMDGKCDFGGGELDAGTSTDVFVAKITASGDSAWSHNYGSAGELQVGRSITLDPQQNIALTGYFKGTMAFGATTLTEATTSNQSNTDLFVAKLAANGDAQWARSFGDDKDQAAWAVAADAANNVIVGGGFEGTINLPPSHTSSGKYDSFWLKLAP